MSTSAEIRWFLDSLPPGEKPGFASMDDLPARLDALLARAEASAPEVPVERTSFVRYLAERLGDRGEPAERLASVFVEDLYLACGCTSGLEPAAREMVRRHREDALVALRQLPIDREE